MTVAAVSSSLELFAGGEAFPVARVGREMLSLKGRIGDAAARLERFTLSIASGGRRVNVRFAGTVATNRDAVTVAPEDRPRLAAAAAAAVGSLDAGSLRALAGAAQPRARRARRARGRTLLVVACLVLGAYVGLRLWEKVTTIEPRIAWLATDTATLLSPTSGRVSFVETLGAIQSGQPVVGIETNSGRSLLIDAPGNVDIVSAERTEGQRVKRGDPLLAYAEPNAPLYLYALVDREQAFRLAGGAHVRYSRLDTGSAAVTFDAAPTDLHIRALPADHGHQLYEVRVPVAAGEEQFRALPVHLRFEQDLQSSVIESLRSIGLPDLLVQGAEAAASLTGVTR
jgi:hypothetical protein